MYRKQIYDINADLKKTRKAIIAIGCSFVQGQGAIDDELYDNYKWKELSIGNQIEIEVSKLERDDLLKKYPLLCKPHDLEKMIDFTFMEYDNAFVNVLCKKYFNGKYTPINLGQRGCGNRASIKELYFYPDLYWHLIEEIIVIYMPSGLERVDFVNDQWQDHFHWVATWPYYKDMEDSPDKKLREGYGRRLYSEKFEILEQISHVQELITWCSAKNAKLIITPGFDIRYNKKYFKKNLNKTIFRNDFGEIDNFYNSFFTTNPDTDLLNLFPWDLVFKPDNYETFALLCMGQESLTDTTDHFFQFLNNRSPGGWITSCAHPGKKSHDLFAKKLFEYIEKGNLPCL